jgi:hypothetical protein
VNENVDRTARRHDGRGRLERVVGTSAAGPARAIAQRRALSAVAAAPDRCCRLMNVLIGPSAPTPFPWPGNLISRRDRADLASCVMVKKRAAKQWS